jgi:hypothetical protein
MVQEMSYIQSKFTICRIGVNQTVRNKVEKIVARRRVEKKTNINMGESRREQTYWPLEEDFVGGAMNQTTATRRAAQVVAPKTSGNDTVDAGDLRPTPYNPMTPYREF